VLGWNRPKASGLMGAVACPARWPKAEGRPSRPVDVTWRAHWVVTAHGTPTVAWLSASSRATRCGGTGGGSSSAKRGKCRVRWYQRGRTEAAVWDSGVPGVSDELRWSAEVVASAWSTGKWRGGAEEIWVKNLRRRSSP
jgi:hypothetical protein